jgi:hypothetical protein
MLCQHDRDAEFVLELDCRCAVEQRCVRVNGFERKVSTQRPADAPQAGGIGARANGLPESPDNDCRKFCGGDTVMLAPLQSRTTCCEAPNRAQRVQRSTWP